MAGGQKYRDVQGIYVSLNYQVPAGGDKQAVGLSPTTGQSLASSGAPSPASGVLSPAAPQDKHIPLNKLFENLQVRPLFFLSVKDWCRNCLLLPVAKSRSSRQLWFIFPV